jgi:predicted membrane channel-forming protein YqfA (hemolysin III family)
VTYALTLVSAIVAASSAYVILYCSSKFNDTSKYYKIYIVGTMVVPILLYLFPMVFKACVDPSLQVIASVATTVCALTLGLVFYTVSIPERFIPGTFDLCGYSHNLMHICLIIAHVAEFVFIKTCIKLKHV